LSYTRPPAAIKDVFTDAELSVDNGTIICPAKNFAIYNTLGMNVTAQNGNLKGIYIVKYNGKATAILVQ